MIRSPAIPALILILLAILRCGTPSPAPSMQGLPATAQAGTPPQAPGARFVATSVPARSARILVSGSALYATHSPSETLSRLALPDGVRQWQTKLGCEPGTLAGSVARVFVTCRDSGMLLEIDAESGSISRSLYVGHGPFGVVAGQERLFISLEHDNAILALDVFSLKEVARTPAGRQPRGLALFESRLFAIHLLDASVIAYDASDLTPIASAEYENRGGFAESITLDPRRERAYVAHERMNVTNLALTFKSTVFPTVSTLDTAGMQYVPRESFSLDAVDTPQSMPDATVLSPDGDKIYVVNAASDDMAIIDVSQGVGVGHVPVGSNPRDLAIASDGSLVYVLNDLSGSISVIGTETLQSVAQWHFADDPRPDVIREGQRLFSTSSYSTISRERWIACAACHFEAGPDGNTWLGTTGGPRNTPTIRGIARTDPFHWSADLPDIRAAQSFIRDVMGGTGLSDQQLDAISDYLYSLRPLTSPARLPDGSLSEQAAHGASVFVDAGCSECHSGPHLTDRLRHYVGTGAPVFASPSGQGVLRETKGPEFDTPSLRELWLSAPYLHDGRAATLLDVLTTQNPGEQHGSTGSLLPEDLAALEQFLLALPLDEGETSLLGEE